MRNFSSALRDIPEGLTTNDQIILLTSGGHHYVSYDREQNLVAAQPMTPDTADLQRLVRAYENLAFTSLGTLRSVIYAHRPGQPLTIRASLMTLIGNYNRKPVELRYVYQSSGLQGRSNHHVVAAVALPWDMQVNINKMSAVMRMQLIKNPELILDAMSEYSGEFREIMRSLDLQVDRDATLALIEQLLSNPGHQPRQQVILLRDPYYPMPDLSWYHHWLTSTQKSTRRWAQKRSFQSWHYTGPAQIDALIEAILLPGAILRPGATMIERGAEDVMTPAITARVLETALEQQTLDLDPPEKGTIPIRKAFQKEVLEKCPNWPDVVGVEFAGQDDSGDIVSITGIKNYEEVTVTERCHTPDSLSSFEYVTEIEKDRLGDKIISHIENLAYLMLEQQFPGWEINEGSQGTINIYLKAEEPYAKVESYMQNEPEMSEEEEEQENEA